MGEKRGGLPGISGSPLAFAEAEKKDYGWRILAAKKAVVALLPVFCR